MIRKLIKLFYWPINKIVMLHHDYHTQKFNENYVRWYQTHRRLEFFLKQKRDE